MYKHPVNNSLLKYCSSLDVSEVDGQNINFHQSQHSPIIGITRGGTTGMSITTGRPTVSLPSPRQHQQQVNHQRDRRSLPCQVIYKAYSLCYGPHIVLKVYKRKASCFLIALMQHVCMRYNNKMRKLCK